MIQLYMEKDLALQKTCTTYIYCLLLCYKNPGGSFSTSEMLISYYYFLVSLV